MKALGVDIGGSGIKAAVVDTKDGQFVGKRKRIETPQPATPDAVTRVVVELVRLHEWEGPVGIAFPGVITHGVVRTAANLDPGWIDLDLVKHLRKATGCHVHVMNDADAAGLAEARFGGLDGDEVVLFLTLGTGIGSALIVRGDLVENTELGHLELHGGDAERYAAESAASGKR
jgi:polyphosphate glucokinase